MTNPIIVFVGGTMTTEDGHRLDSRQPMDPLTESVVRTALLCCPTWWEVVKSLVLPIAEERGWGIVAHTYRTLWHRDPSDHVKLVKRGDLYSKPGVDAPTIEIVDNLMNLTYAEKHGFNVPGKAMLVLPDTAWLRSQAFKSIPQPDPVRENAELYRNPLRECRLVPSITDFRVTGLIKDAQWTNPESLEAARVKVHNGSRIPLWTLYTSALRQALAPIEFPILDGAATLPPRCVVDFKRKADAVPHLHEELSKADWRVASFINYLPCCIDACGCRNLDGSTYAVNPPGSEAFVRDRDFLSIHHPKLELVIKEHSVSVMVKNFHWTTFDVNQWIDDHIARWDEVSLVPRKREMNITPRAAAASLRYRKPWDVQYEAGRRLNDHRWVCIWQLEKGWMDPDIDWRAIGRELADCSAGWRPLMQKLMRAFVVESKWRDAMNDKSANSAPVGHYTLPDGRVITFNPPPLSARGRKRKQRHRAA